MWFLFKDVGVHSAADAKSDHYMLTAKLKSSLKRHGNEIVTGRKKFQVSNLMQEDGIPVASDEDISDSSTTRGVDEMLMLLLYYMKSHLTALTEQYCCKWKMLWNTMECVYIHIPQKTVGVYHNMYEESCWVLH